MKRWTLLFLLISIRSEAFDPFTIAAVASAASQAIGGSGTEASGSLDAFSELYSEIDTDAEINDEGQKLISQIEEIQSLANEAGYTADDIDQLGHQDGNEIKKLEGNIRAVTRAVRAGKRAYKLIQRLEQKAQSAQVESTAVQKEQLAAMYRMVRYQQEASLADTKRDLMDQINKRKQITDLRTEEKDSGAKVFGATGVLAFPRSERVIETSLDAASRIRGPLFGLMLAVFLTRLIFYQFGFFGVSRIGDLVRDTIVCSLLLLVYPEIVRAVITYSLEIASHIGSTTLQEIKPKDLVLPGLKDVFTSTKLLFLYGIEWIKYAGFATIEFFMTFGLSFMVMLFPLVIFASQMLNFSIAWPIFLGGFISLALWPLFWNLVGLAAELSWGQTQRTFAESLYSIFFTILQLISPFIGIKLISGQPLSKAIQESARAVTSPLAHGTRTLIQSKNDFKYASQEMKSENPTFHAVGSNGLPSMSTVAGAAHGWFGNQLHHRTNNANEAASKPDAQSNYMQQGNAQSTSPLKAFVLNNSNANEGNPLKHALTGLKARPMNNSNNQERNT